ncbi:hypothetical protein DFR50_116112 [Roseiarcus fermentans]|uniref:DUF6867 domain-containing protein n=1 Tax=Roseiarcus fermentans TaxID=1473586 RepID=A0A366F9X5_9HYPH|nr:hypothetical protein [Roseiarcus fermentans]RBP11417.1 hypothetical protein DFR50_116112 [Roseiarcus fermentans]
MAGILYSDTPWGLVTFVLLTLVLGGAGAWASGRALAQTWRPVAMILLYMLFLTAGVRFLHYALYGEPLLSAQFFLVAYVWNTLVAGFGYRAMRAQQMATQYSWAYERVGLSWRARSGA